MKQINHQEIFKYWLKLKPQILKIAKKVVKFNNVNDIEDYIQFSYPALCEAIKKYNFFESGMKPETYYFWYIEKFLHKMAKQGGEITYEVYLDGEFQFYLENDEYRRYKKKLKEKGFTVVSKKRTYVDSELIFNKGSFIENRKHE